MKEIEFTFESSTKKTGLFFMVTGFVLIACSIFIFIKNNPGIYYFAVPGVISAFIGAWLYNRTDNYYVMTPDTKEIWYYSRDKGTKNTEIFHFDDIKAVELQGESYSDMRFGRYRRRRRYSNKYRYFWRLALVLKNSSRELVLTDYTGGNKEGPHSYVMRPENLAGIIGCPAVIRATFLDEKIEIYNP